MKINEFLEHINEHTEQEILNNMQHINTYFRTVKYWWGTRELIEKILKIVDKNKIIYELFKDEMKFSKWNDKLDFSDKLHFGLEIEVTELPLDAIKYAFDTGAITEIMKVLEVPSEMLDKIVQNSDFEKKNVFDKWIFSREGSEASEDSEASSPICQNNICDLNQIVAICILLKSFGARLHGGTGLHINIGANYLECNEKAIENLLKIWGECEELFYKIANPEGEVMRVVAKNMAQPIKENIQDFFEEDGSVTLSTENDIERFLYQIQAKNRMNDIIDWSSYDINEELDVELLYAKTDDEKFQIFHRYSQAIKNKETLTNKVRYTSINFNHMEWNTDNSGRIEIRIFNSSLEPEVIFQDLELVGKLFEVSLENAKNPEYKKFEFEKLMLRNVNEREKVDNLLNLLFDSTVQKEIFRRRWESVKKMDEYNRYKSGQDTFQQEI